MPNPTVTSGGGGGGGGGGLGGSSLPIVKNPNGKTAQSIVVGGVEVIATSSKQTSGVEVPTKSLERGAEISQRNVVEPDTGTITGAVGPSGLSSLKGLARRRDPISITTPESTIQKCVVESVQRTRKGEYTNKFGVVINWRQVLIAQVGSVEIKASTGDGKKTKGSGNTSPVSLSGSGEKNPEADPNESWFETMIENLVVL